MKIHYSTGVYVRHAEGESMVWCPRTDGCTIMRDVKPFLEEIGREWQGINEIKKAIAEKFGCAEADIDGDFRIVLDELIAQGFVECAEKESRVSATGEIPVVPVNRQDVRSPSSEEDNSALEDFCNRHGILVELHIDLTDACTERCVHCYVPKGQKDFLPVELVEKALVEFRAMNGLTIHLTGGEAMMHPDFERICRKCVELNLNFIIFSNMTLCDDKRIARERGPRFRKQLSLRNRWGKCVGGLLEPFEFHFRMEGIEFAEKGILRHLARKLVCKFRSRNRIEIELRLFGGCPQVNRRGVYGTPVGISQRAVRKFRECGIEIERTGKRGFQDIRKRL